VLEHLVGGDSNKLVAEKLGVSPRTVEFHRAHIMDKTGARSLPDLVRFWLADRSPF
jgi:two-component system, LuxR family, response regulator FixJ